jgi:gluconolactonase
MADRAAFEVLASGYRLVEGPTIDPDGGLLFSDVLGGGVHRFTPDGSVTTLVPKRRGVGGIALHADGGIVVSGRDVVHVRDGVTTPVLRIDGVAGWNDLCTDVTGRVYAGALRFPVFDRDAVPVPGELWRAELDGDRTELYGGVVHANGVALSPDGRTIYHSDTRSIRVLVHDLDEHGLVRNPRVIDTAPYGMPDGMAIDEDGGVWVAIVGGYGLARFLPNGDFDRRLEVPSPFVTSLCFGGHDGRDLYVTTGGHNDAALGGCVLRGRAPIPGVAVSPARVTLG